MAATTPYDPAHDAAVVRQLTAAFSGAFGGTGSPDPTPIFVVGLPRSGSTLVEQILASHSQVWAAGEDTDLAPLTGEVNRRLARADTDQVAVMKELGERYVALMRARVPPAWRRQHHAAGAGTGVDGNGATGRQGVRGGNTQQQVHGLGPEPSPQQQQQQVQAGRSGGQGAQPDRIVDKMLRNLWLVGYIHLLLPHSTILHVVRHPLDVALSCYSQPFGYSGLPWTWDLEHIAAQVEFTWQMADHWDAVLPGRVVTVMYEELVAHPEEVARQLLSACDLPWEDGVLSFHTTQRPVATASVAQVRRPLYTSAVGRWGAYARHLEGVAARLAPLVERYEARLAAAAARRRHGAQSAGGDPADPSTKRAEPAAALGAGAGAGGPERAGRAASADEL